MKKNNLSKAAQSALSVTLSLAMAMSGAAAFPVSAIADDGATLIKSLDFNQGLAEFRYDETTAPDGDPNYEVVKSDSVYYVKTGDQVELNADGTPNDKTDANGLVYEGTGTTAHYTTTVISNQPSTSTDDVKGTALTFGDTVSLPEIVKGQSAAIEGDDETTTALDTEIKPGDPARGALTNKSKLYMSNPLYEQTAEAYTITYWTYIPEGTEEDASLMVFEGADETATITLYYDYDSEAMPAGTWAQVAAVFTADGVQFYVNGQPVEEQYVEVKGTYSLAALTTPEKLAFGGSDDSDKNTVFDSKLDDVSFYAGALTADEIAAAYTDEAATLSAAVDVDSPAAVYPLSDASSITELTDGCVTFVTDTVAGKSVTVAKVAANKKLTTMTGFYISENPFADVEDLEGVTIGYWYKQAAATNNTGSSYSLFMLDDAKYVYFLKDESKNQEASSYLYVSANMSAYFKEGGFSTSLSNSLQNTYSFSADTDTATAISGAATEWHYVTLTATNAGIQMYLDGEPVENAATDVTGGRFSDGYYQTLKDRDKVTTLYGVFGGTNNQLATALMTFFGYKDTKMYFAWTPKSVNATGYSTDRSGESYFYNVSCYAGAMSDKEVAALYAKETGSSSGGDDIIYGDVNGDEKVTSADALVVLQYVVELNTLTADQFTAADVSGEGEVTANDALLILQRVVELFELFPVQK